MRSFIRSAIFLLLGSLAFGQTLGTTTLRDGITSTSQYLIYLTSTTKVTRGSYLLVDSEQMAVTSVSGQGAYVTRGVAGCAAVVHSAGATVTIVSSLLSTCPSANINLHAPGAIGDVTPSTGAFTNVNVTGTCTGCVNLHTPGAIGDVTPSTGAFTDIISKSPALDVRSMGSYFTADDAATWQAAINKFSGTGWDGSAWHGPTASGKILCPAGVSHIKSTLVYNGAPGYALSIEGVGNDAGGTAGCTLVWDGANGGTVIQTNGAFYGILRNVSIIEGTGKIGIGIQVDAHNVTQTGSPGSAYMALDHVAVEISSSAAAKAIALGHSGCVSDQISDLTFRDLYLVGNGTTGTTGIYTYCGANLKNLRIADGQITGLGSGINLGSSIAGLQIDSTFFGNNVDSDLTINGSPNQLTLNSVRSEGSARFINGSLPTQSSILVNGGYWAGTAPADDKIIQGGGAIHLNGWDCSNSRTGSTRCIIIAPNPLFANSFGGDGLFVRGSFFLNAGNNTATNWPFYDGSTNPLPGMSNFYDIFGLPIGLVIEDSFGGVRGATTMVALTAANWVGDNVLAGYVQSVGTTSHYAAQSGFIRMKAADAIKIHNNAENADLNIVSLDANDRMVVGDAAGLVTSGPVMSTSQTVALTADWTCGTSGTVSTCAAATIIGSGGGVPLTFTLPLIAQSWTLECDLVVGQATAATANSWNLLTATNGATNVTASYDMHTAATAMTGGATTDQASTTTTFLIGPTWTLGATGTKMPVKIWARVEGASVSGTVLSLQLVAPTAADVVTIYRGSSCRIR